MIDKKLFLALSLSTAAMLMPGASKAQGVDIYACYACQNTGNSAIDAALAANPSVASDGLLFAFVNNTGLALTGAQFSVANASPNDAFNIGAIGVGATVIVLPGLSDDGAVHPSGGLFKDRGATQDTSDGDGGVSDAAAFTFSAMSGAGTLSSGSIVPGSPGLIMTWRDPGATGKTSFIGLGPNGDGGCSNCYFGKIGVAAAVPEPETYALMLVGLGFLSFAAKRRTR